MNLSGKAKKAGVILGIMIIIVLVCTGAFISIMNKPVIAQHEKPEEHLFIEETYLLRTGETNKTVNVTCTPYMTNIWDEESGDVKVIAYVVKTSNKIAEYKNTVEIGKIAGDTTAEIEIPIILTSDNFKVDLLIFEDEKLVLKGSFTIKAVQKLKYNESGGADGFLWDLENSPCVVTSVQHDVPDHTFQ